MGAEELVSLEPFEVQEFGGWVERADPLEIGWAAATDLSNVDLDNDGRLATRAGTVTVSSTPSGTRQLFAFGDTTNYDEDFLVSRFDGLGSPIAALRNVDAGVTYATAFGDSDSVVLDYTQVGTPTASVVFFALSNNRMMRWQVGAADIANATTNTRPKFLDKVPESNRLAIANFSTASYAPGGSGGSPSTVWFSSATDPDSFDANDFVHLSPGDGEQITGVVAFKTFVMVFKQTRMFVFYGESVGPTGDPEFNRRAVDLGCRVGVNGDLKYAVGRTGVYFMAEDGLYVTDGGTPVRIGADAISTDWWLDAAITGMALARERVYIHLTYSATAYVLVYDIEGGYWLKWADLNVGSYGGMSSLTSSAGELYFLGGNNIVKLDDSRTVGYDDSVIAAYYYTGSQQMSAPGAEGVIRETLLDGSGTLTAQLVADGVASSSASVTPTAATVGRYRRAARGRTFQLKLSSSSGAWSLSRVVANVQPARRRGAS